MARANGSGNGARRERIRAANGLVLGLAPLERDCMHMLWPAGEATVRDIRDALAAVRPRAYTTIMTIMDRLAHKGVVERHKVGKKYVYRANLTAEQARAFAVEQLVENYFEGSRAALMAYLNRGGPASAPAHHHPSVRRAPQATPSRTKPPEQPRAAGGANSEASATKPGPAESPMDDTLL
ncbi:MAG: BlaI/MecI/CopY family transcriptional regulator [Candidatus Acidiferrales bacterium]